MKGKICIQEVEKDYATNIPCFIISVPIYKLDSDNIVGVLCDIMTEEELKQQIELPVLGGLARFHIIDSDGNILILSDKADKNGNPNNFINNDFEEVFEYNELLANLKEGKKGSFGFKLHNSESQFVTYQPININDWFLLLIAPTSILFEKQRNIQFATILFTCVAIGVIFFLWSLTSMIKRKSEIEINKLAFYDSLTGAYNYEKFRLEFEKRKDIFSSSYALAILDITNFRLLNNIFGVTVGDWILKNLYELIRDNIMPKELYCRISDDKFLLLIKCSDKEETLNRLINFFNVVEDSTFKFEKLHYRIVCRCGVYQLDSKDSDISLQTLVDYSIEARESISAKKHSSVAFFDDKLLIKLEQKTKSHNICILL